MPSTAAYPPDLAKYVVDNWPKTTPLRISQAQLGDVLSVAFQASLTVEEARPIRFRLLLTPADALPESGSANEGVLRLRFDRRRPMSVDEIRRLAPAAPFESSLIGVEEHNGRLSLWGLAHSGPAWLSPAWGGRNIVPIWTKDPIVHVSGPGRLAVRTAGVLVGALERGALVDTTMDVFASKWLATSFAREREEVRAAHAAQQATAPSPTLVETSLIGRVSQQMLRRAIQIIRGARHGGLILITDSSCALAGESDELDLTGVQLKYRFVNDEPPKRYRALLTSILHELATASSKAVVAWKDFATSESPELSRLEHAVFEWSRLVANLAAIDGAVVLDKRFALIGFGAEVSTELPSPPRVFRALDVEGVRREPHEVEEVGTRHRAAYRFVHGHPDGLAVAISQDGGVTFVAQRDGDVVFWEQSVGP